MSKTTTQGQNGTDVLTNSLARQVARSFTLGVDADGYEHHYWAGADAVVVYDEDGVDRVEHLDGRPVRDWKNYVAGERGWTSSGPFATLAMKYDAARKSNE